LNTQLIPSNVRGFVTDDPRFIASRDGSLNGKLTYLWHLTGRRGGTGASDFASTSAYNDLAPFLGTGSATLPADPVGANTEVVSSSANDTSAGTGARVVRVTYLDVNGNVAHTDVTMNGVTPVSLAGAVYHPLWLETVTVGSGGVAAGNIDLRNTSSPTTIYDRIVAGFNKSRAGRMTVPAGYNGYLTHWQVNAVSADGDYSIAALRFTENGAISTVLHTVDLLFVPSNNSTGDELDYIKCPPLSLVNIRVIPSSSAAAVRMDASFGMLLVQQ